MMFTTASAESSPNRRELVMESADRLVKRRVLIVDDHAVVRAGFKQLIDSTEDMEVVAEAGTAAAALDFAVSVECDVVLLDISLPDASVLETVSMLRRRRPTLPILIVSMHSEEQYAVNLLRAGASGFFPKAGEAKDLLEATGNAPEPAHRQLSNREFQVFVQLACGKTVTQIAEEVHLSVKTISTYRTRILQKMNCSRNADLTAYALQHNLMGATPPPDVGVRSDLR